MDVLSWVNRSLASLCWREMQAGKISWYLLKGGGQRELLTQGGLCSQGGWTSFLRSQGPAGSGDGSEEPQSRCLCLPAITEMLKNTELWVSLRGEDVLSHPGLYLEWKMCWLRENWSCALLQAALWAGNPAPSALLPILHTALTPASSSREPSQPVGRPHRVRPGFPG